MKYEDLSAEKQRQIYESMGKAFLNGLIAGLEESGAIDTDKEKE